jgi:hypothetical protein
LLCQNQEKKLTQSNTSSPPLYILHLMHSCLYRQYHPPSSQCYWHRLLYIQFRPFNFFAPKDFKYFDFPVIRDWAYLMKVVESTWWRLLNVPDEGYWAYLMKVIERTWWRLLSVPDEGYSRNALCTLNMISTFL